MKIYLDNCCYNSQFDIQNDTMIKLKISAKLFILALVKYVDVELESSYILAEEVYRISFEHSHPELIPPNAKRVLI